MKIVVFGANGGIGAHVVEQGLQSGHIVTAVVRRPESLTTRHERLEIVKGDVMEPSSIQSAVIGQDVVVSTLGVRHREPTTLYSQGVTNIMQAMQSAHVSRILCISASGLYPTIWWQRIAAKVFLWRAFKHMYTDLVRMETEVTASHLDWTILRPPAFNDGPRTGHYQSSINQPLKHGWQISRADIADYIVKHLNDPATYCGLVEMAY